MSNKLLAAGAVIALWGSSAFAHQYSCNVSIASGMNFGSYHHSKDSYSTGSFSISCQSLDGELEPTGPGAGGTNESPIRVCADTGRYALGSYNTRRMQRAAFAAGIPIANQRTEYNLYTDASYTQVWGDGSQGTGCIIVSPNDHKQFFAKMPEGQKGAYPGRYDDRVTVSFSY